MNSADDAITHFQSLLTHFGDDEVMQDHGLDFEPGDTEEQLKQASAALGVPVPPELARLLITKGGFQSHSFGDAWQTIQVFSADVLQAGPSGVIDFIEWVWGGRPELQEAFSAQEIQALNVSAFVFGRRYQDDNVHDYLYFKPDLGRAWPG